MSLLLVRHASAGKQEEWGAADAERPLDERGEAQAAHLPDVLSRFPIERILSSPAKRCLDTVGPLAAARGLTVELREELSPERQDRDGHSLVRSLAGQNVIVCGHGGPRDGDRRRTALAQGDDVRRRRQPARRVDLLAVQRDAALGQLGDRTVAEPAAHNLQRRVEQPLAGGEDDRACSDRARPLGGDAVARRRAPRPASRRRDRAGRQALRLRAAGRRSASAHGRCRRPRRPCGARAGRRRSDTAPPRRSPDGRPTRLVARRSVGGSSGAVSRGRSTAARLARRAVYPTTTWAEPPPTSTTATVRLGGGVASPTAPTKARRPSSAELRTRTGQRAASASTSSSSSPFAACRPGLVISTSSSSTPALRASST